MKTLTETHLRNLIRQVILEQTLPTDMEISIMNGKKSILFTREFPINKPATLSFLIKSKNEMAKYIKSLPNGKVVGDLTIEGDYNTLTLALGFETSMPDAELQKL
jgi:hypothetical protein